LHDDDDPGNASAVYGSEGEVFKGLLKVFNELLSSMGGVVRMTELLDETGAKTDRSYEALRPFLSQIEPAVAAALAETHFALSDTRDRIGKEPVKSPSVEMARRDVIPALADSYRVYFAAGDRLHRAISTSPFQKYILGWRRP
jgi:hypothetical protein